MATAPFFVFVLSSKMTHFFSQTERHVAPSKWQPSGMVALSNRFLDLMWQKGWSTRPDLDPIRLLSKAMTLSGLQDFGEENGWRERLYDLCSALHNEASLSALGRTIAFGQIVAALTNRLRNAELWRRHEEIAQIPISRPIIVVGQMRSGSTRVQRLLACDSRLTFTRFFESWNPVCRWPNAPFDDRVLRGWLALRIAKCLNPHFDIVHPARTLDCDEEIGLHNISLYGAAFEAQWRIPSFIKAGENNNNRPVYEEFRRYLQTIRWLRKDHEDKPWILKIPQFSQDLLTVLDVFPDARVVLLDRDAVQVVGSSASLTHNQMIVQSDGVDRNWVGEECLRKTLLRKSRLANALQHHSHPRVFLSFEKMQGNWKQEMRSVYSMLGLDFSSDLQAKMRSYMQDPRHKVLSAHQYNLAEFGLTEAEVKKAFENNLGHSELTLEAA